MIFFSLLVFLLFSFLPGFAQEAIPLPDSLGAPDSLGIYHPAEVVKKERNWWVVPYPVIAYTPETKWIGGAYIGAVARFKGAEQPSSAALQLMYSERKQIITGFWPEIYLGKWRGKLEVEYLRWPDTFFGIGNDTREEDAEDYAVRVVGIEAGLAREVRPHLFLGLRNHFEAAKLTSAEAGGMLAQGMIPGSRQGTTHGVFATGSWDSRDHIFAPRAGVFAQGWAGIYRKGLGSEFTYNRYGLDARRYVPLGGTHSLAFQAYGSFTEGTPHFRHLSKLGGDVRMRGYYEGRYRDKQHVMAQAEYRFPIWKGFRGAVFAGAGDVTDELAHFTRPEFKHSWGGGLRYMLIPKEKISLRVDVGYGADSDAFYIGVNEAF